MFTTRTRQTAAALATSFALLGLAACGGSDEPAAEKTTATTAAPEATEATTEAPPAASSGDQPDWAKPVTEVGEKITTIKVGDITVDVFQVGTAQATKTGQFVDPDNNKPIIDKGDEIVFVNYVITNTGAPIDLGSSLVDVNARYDDWKFMQGMDSIVDQDLFAAQKVNTLGLAPGAFKDPGVYTLGTDQTFTYGENFRYQKDSPITFDASATPVDAQGEACCTTRRSKAKPRPRSSSANSRRLRAFRRLGAVVRLPVSGVP
ncbi:hypothetical protein [Aeromicrobium sp. UC242_57]|uniref:hypothetical protein n=1 Tax=Aeromicrobium sp. UC242_57 TaxID=3374624 RepID=UPI0037A3C52B